MAGLEMAMSRQTITKKSLIRFVLGGVLGALVGGGFITVIESLKIPIKHLTWADGLAYWLGVTYFGVGLVLYVITYNRKELADNLEGGHAKLPASDDEVGIYRRQAIAMILAGTLILTPLVAMGPRLSGKQVASFIFAGMVALWGLQTYFNVEVWRRSDEFTRVLQLKVAAVTFALVQGALFLWAGAEHLHLVRTISSWDSLMILMTVYLVTSVFFTVQNRPAS